MSDITNVQMDVMRVVETKNLSPAETVRFAPKYINNKDKWNVLYNTGSYGAEFYFPNYYKNESSTDTLPLDPIQHFEHHVQLDFFGTGNVKWIDIYIDYATSNRLTLNVDSNVLADPITLGSYNRSVSQEELYIRIGLIYNSNTGTISVKFEEEAMLNIPSSINVNPEALVLLSFGGKIFNTHSQFQGAELQYGFLTSNPVADEISIMKPWLKSTTQEIVNSNNLTFNATSSEIANSYASYINHRINTTELIPTLPGYVEALNSTSASEGKILFTTKAETDISGIAPNVKSGYGVTGTESGFKTSIAASSYCIPFQNQIRKFPEAFNNLVLENDIDVESVSNIVNHWKELPSNGLFGFQVNFNIPETINQYVPAGTASTNIRETIQTVTFERRSTFPVSIDQQEIISTSTLSTYGAILTEYLCKITLGINWVARTDVNNETVSSLQPVIFLRTTGVSKIFENLDTGETDVAADYSYNELSPKEIRIPIDIVDFNDTIKTGLYLDPETGKSGLVINDRDYGFVSDSLIREPVYTTEYNLKSFNCYSEIYQSGAALTNVDDIDFETELSFLSSESDIIFPQGTYDFQGNVLNNSAEEPLSVDFNDSFQSASQSLSARRIVDWCDRTSYVSFYPENVRIWEPDSQGIFAHVFNSSKLPLLKRASSSNAILKHDSFTQLSSNSSALNNNQVRIRDGYVVDDVPLQYPIHSGNLTTDPTSSFLACEYKIENIPLPENMGSVLTGIDDLTSKVVLELGIEDVLKNSPNGSDVENSFVLQIMIEPSGTKVTAFNTIENTSTSTVITEGSFNILDPTELYGSCDVALYFSLAYFQFGVKLNGNDLGYIPGIYPSFNFSKSTLYADVYEVALDPQSLIIGSTISVTPNEDINTFVNSFTSGTSDFFGNTLA